MCDDVGAWAATWPGARREVIAPAFTVSRPLPRTLEPEVHPSFVELTSYPVPEQVLVTVPDARIRSIESKRHQHLALVVLPDDQFVGELAALTPEGRRRMLRDQPAYHRKLPRRPPRMAGDHIAFLGFGVQHYYHWSHDLVMGASAAVDRLPPDTRVVVPARFRPWHEETLALLGLDDHPRVAFAPGECWQLERLHVVTPKLKTQIDHPAPFRWFREAAFARYGLGDAVTPTRRVYLSRRDDNHWRTTNEDEVEALLGAHGFETVMPGRLTFREQVELFRETDVLVGTGAGLFNMVFCPPGTKVLQFQEPRHMIHALWTQASAMGIDYHYVLGDSVPNPGFDDADIHMPIDKLAAALDALDLDRR